MPNIIKFHDSGFMVEVERSSGAVAIANAAAAPAAVKLEQAMKSIAPLLSAVQETTLNALDKANFKEAEVKLGLSFTIEGNVFVSKVSGEANLEVTLKFGK